MLGCELANTAPGRAAIINHMIKTRSIELIT